MYVCMYVYIYIYTHTHIHIYIYVYVYVYYTYRWGHIEGNLDVQYLVAVTDLATDDTPPTVEPAVATDYWLSHDSPFGIFLCVGFDIVGRASALRKASYTISLRPHTL
jgi:hypothetical protein